MSFEPILYRLKVKPDAFEEITAGGIVIPKQTAEKEQTATVTGTVVSVGQSAFEGAALLKSGDRVLYAKYGGLIHRENGEEFRFLNDEDIIAIERG